MNNPADNRPRSAGPLTATLKRWLGVGLLLLAVGCFALSAAMQSPVKPSIDSSKVLIVYLSRTNNTKAVAGMIHDAVGGTLVALELEHPYPTNYQAIVQQVVHENETNYLPPLRTRIANLKQYEVVLVGFPTWGMQLPPPIKSFLAQPELRGKTLVPFNTNAGYGVGSSFDTFKKLAPNSTVLEGFSTRGGVERDGVLFVMEGKKATQVQQDVTAWLKKIKLL